MQQLPPQASQEHRWTAAASAQPGAPWAQPPQTIAQPWNATSTWLCPPLPPPFAAPPPAPESYAEAAQGQLQAAAPALVAAQLPPGRPAGQQAPASASANFGLCRGPPSGFSGAGCSMQHDAAQVAALGAPCQRCAAVPEMQQQLSSTRAELGSAQREPKAARQQAAEHSASAQQLQQQRQGLHHELQTAMQARAKAESEVRPTSCPVLFHSARKRNSLNSTCSAQPVVLQLSFRPITLRRLTCHAFPATQRDALAQQCQRKGLLGLRRSHQPATSHASSVSHTADAATQTAAAPPSPCGQCSALKQQLERFYPQCALVGSVAGTRLRHPVAIDW